MKRIVCYPLFHLYFPTHPCHPEPREGSIYTRFFSTELHSNRLKIKSSDANEEVKQVFCQPLGNGVSRDFSIYIICNIDKIFTFGEIIFLIERCIVKKKTYLCSVRLEKWPDTYKKAFFALSWY